MKESTEFAGWAAAALLVAGIFQGMAAVTVQKDSATGQVVVTEDARPVLQYNYQTIEPGERLAQVSAGNRIYARARSDYIHPLYEPGGAVLTKDWPVDHPHHRGIYWAWPEVQYGQELGDLHALQKVFSRATGRLLLRQKGQCADIEAENQWLWEDKEAVVREHTLIRVHPADDEGRAVDLTFRFIALKDGVTLARRGTEAYGGLNIRLDKPASQEITAFTDPTNASPRIAWSDVSGVFTGGKAPAGLAVFQHAGNVDYPGDWVQYPDLGWCQPTFPAAKTRYALSRDKPLVLRYRLWIHAGGKLAADKASRLWAAYNSPEEQLPEFELK